jgi:hypothetical protein
MNWTGSLFGPIAFIKDGSYPRRLTGRNNQ